MTTKEELLARLNDIEWTDFEVKEASGGLPKSMWETVKREWALDALPNFWIDYMEIPGDSYATATQDTPTGIDKILGWSKLTGRSVTFESDMLISTVTYPLTSTKDYRNASENNGENKILTTRERLIALIKENPRITRTSLSEHLGISSSNVQFHIERLKSEGVIERIGSPRNGYWEFSSE